MTARSFGDLARRQLRTSAGKTDSRRKLMGAVRAAASRMQLSDDDRRAIQEEVTGKPSMADMTLAELGKLLDRLNKDRPAPMAHRAHVGKIRALWWTLYWLGETAEPNDAALDAFVRRQTGIAALRFLDHRKAPAVIEALKSWAMRAGVRWPTQADVDEIAARARPVTLQQAERSAVLCAIWDKLVERQVVRDRRLAAYVHEALGFPADAWAWSTREQDEAIKLIGKRLRRVLDKPVVP